MGRVMVEKCLWVGWEGLRWFLMVLNGFEWFVMVMRCLMRIGFDDVYKEDDVFYCILKDNFCIV